MKTSHWISLFNKTDRSSSDKNKAIMNALSRKLNINEEYKQAFRTTSFIEFTTTNKDNNTISSSPPPSPPPCRLEPDQKLLTEMFQSCNGRHVGHPLLLEYFEASFQAFKACQFLLQTVHQTRINHATVELATTMADDDNQSSDNNGMVYRELFLSLHDTHSELLRKLSCLRNNTRRKLRLRRFGKKVARGCFVISNTAVLVALLVLALHSLVGIVAMPGLIVCFVGSLKKKRRDHKGILRQMEIAARATYITMNDLDTLSRMAVRLDGEVEHLRAVAGMWMRSGGMREILKEFVEEDDAIVEQLKELQQHIYLCCVTINRSRRLVMNEIVGAKD
ncbi:UPF0496 protein At1g20180 [Cucurbita pepo subsp. pepo]|uniref:UPF0496 protein At1g20180 n=1 Tax=Cucurbita pepo subsp. pepo TaxID=3664 RepID=UPI000C9D5F3E|nr:UPF0496 protein At1g20180 [Cucurbita pepo subsp. pepo]